MNDRILFISDQHLPYVHRDSLSFYRYLKKKHRPTRVISLGDFEDLHGINFHDHDPNLPSSGYEINTLIRQAKLWAKVFPQVDFVGSNHGDMVARRALHHGLPTRLFKEKRELMEAPKTWRWHESLSLKLPDGRPLFVHHWNGGEAMRVSQRMGACVIQGHTHGKFYAQHWSSPFGTFWGVQAGWGGDQKSLAFAYGKDLLTQPVLGTAVVINSEPILERMILDSRGRWVGRNK